MSGYTKLYYPQGRVIQVYDTAPGVTTRVSEVVFGTEYNFIGWQTYNFSDDKIYMGGSIGDVWYTFVFDPRTNTIVRQFAGPGFWDVQGDTIWGYGLGGTTTIARDTETGAVVFSIPVTVYSYQPIIDDLYVIQVALPGRRCLTYHYDYDLERIVASVIHITGLTTYVVEHSVPLAEVGWPDDEDLTYARPYIATGNKVWLRAGDMTQGGILGAILSVDTGELVYVYNTHPETSESGDTSPYWDIGGNKITQIGYNPATNHTCVMVIDVASASVLGRAGGAVDSGSGYEFNEGQHLVGFNRALVGNYADGALGSFPYDALGSEADEVLVSDTYSTPIGGPFGSGFDDYPFLNASGVICVPPSSAFNEFWHEFVVSAETP